MPHLQLFLKRYPHISFRVPDYLIHKLEKDGLDDLDMDMCEQDQYEMYARTFRVCMCE